jgi:hypothetical protein
MKSLTSKLMLGFAGCVLASGMTFAAENLIKNGSAENAATVKKWHKKLVLNTDDKVSGKASFQGNDKSIWAFSQELIPVDPSKTYKLSGSFKSIGKDKGRCYLGLVMYNAKKRSINRNSISVYKDTVTELAADVKAGDKVIKLKDCSKWNGKNLNRKIIAWNAKKDFSDLPNFATSSALEKLEKKGDIWEVTLKRPVGKNYPAGTLVREHYTGGGYSYCAASYKAVPDKWTKYTATVTGIAKYGAPRKQFWPGTKYVKAVVIVNYRAKKDSDCKTLFDDISFEEVEAAK